MLIYTGHYLEMQGTVITGLRKYERHTHPPKKNKTQNPPNPKHPPAKDKNPQGDK